MNLNEDDVVLCTVKRIEGTTVFLEIDGNGEGTMIFSEVSPGRIRNIREYVSPGKKIVCKILNIKGNHVHLSLRRVTAKEREEVMESYRREKVLINMIKPVLKEKTNEVIEKIRKEHELSEFIEEIKEDPEILKKFFTKPQVEELKNIFAEKKEKDKIVKREIKITSMGESGVNNLREVLDIKEAEIYYLGSSKFAVEVTAKDYKTANHELEEILETLREKAKKLNAKIEIKEK